MVRLQTLDLRIGVRVPASQPKFTILLNCNQFQQARDLMNCGK